MRPGDVPEHPLADQLERLNDELRGIRDVLDEVRDDLGWALKNGRVILSLADVNQISHVADATIGSDIVSLTLRLHTALAVLREDFVRAVDAQQLERIVASEVERSLPSCDAKGLEPEKSAVAEVSATPAKGELPTGAAIGAQVEPEGSPFQLIRESTARLRTRAWQRSLFDVTDPVLAQGRSVEFQIGAHQYSGEILQIDREGQTAEVCLAPCMETVTVSLEALGIRLADSQPEQVLDPRRLPEITLFEVGDVVRFQEGWEEVLAEVEAFDDAGNQATVVVMDTQRRVSISQDELTRVERPPTGESGSASPGSPQRKEVRDVAADPVSGARSRSGRRPSSPKSPRKTRRRSG